MAPRDVASNLYQARGRGVTRSKRKTKKWLRKATENGHEHACVKLAAHMYDDRPYAREAGHVGEAAGIATSAGVMNGHTVPPDVLTSVVHWLRKGGYNSIDRSRTVPQCFSHKCAGGA
jgi:TPR repeat protein